jgi:deoxyribodipyrimidine photolyase
MEMKFQRSLFLFRRDLRLEDNTGLIFALPNSKQNIFLKRMKEKVIHPKSDKKRVVSKRSSSYLLVEVLLASFSY